MSELKIAYCKVIQLAGGWHSPKAVEYLKEINDNVEINGYNSIVVGRVRITKQEFLAWVEKRNSKN